MSDSEGRAVVLAKDIVIESANSTEKRTVMSEVGIMPETELNFLRTVRRSEDGDFLNDIYQLGDTDYVIVIKHNCGSTEEHINFDIVELKKVSYEHDEIFYEKVSRLSARFGLPGSLCGILGVEECVYVRFINCLKRKISEKVLKALESGNYKSNLYIVLGPELYADINIDNLRVEQMRIISDFITRNYVST